MTGPDTRTSQIYINLVDNTRLDAEGFAPIGKVIEGMEVVDQFYSEYGEAAGGGMRGGKQGPIFEAGNKYLDHAVLVSTVQPADAHFFSQFAEPLAR